MTPLVFIWLLFAFPLSLAAAAVLGAYVYYQGTQGRSPAPTPPAFGWRRPAPTPAAERDKLPDV